MLQLLQIFLLVLFFSMMSRGLGLLLRTSSFQFYSSTSARFLTTNVYIVGKKNGAEAFIASGCAEYEKRLRPVMSLTTHFLKSDDDLMAMTKNLKGVVFALDERGKELTSREFSKLIYDSFVDGGTHVSFIIGGFAGLPPEVRNRYPLLTLSRMTWTHQMARLLLLEQIYRASEIHKGSSYHKD